MLEKFRKAKTPEIERLKKIIENGGMPVPDKRERPDFAGALRKDGAVSIIAEYKRASPSKGEIRKDLSVEDAVKSYEEHGASAVSILTEESWFAGDFNFIDRAKSALQNKNLPLLRKDFIFDSSQIRATAFSEASAVLLITRCLNGWKQLAELLKEAEAYGLQCVVEVFDEEDLDQARKAEAGIIQVNARDLSSLVVDRNRCLDLIKRNKPQKGEVWIAASGMEEPDHLQQAHDAGYNAVLIGTSLMKYKNPGEGISRLLGGFPC